MERLLEVIGRTVGEGMLDPEAQPIVSSDPSLHQPIPQADGHNGSTWAQDASERAFSYAGKLGTAEGAIASALISLEVGRPDWALQTLTKYMEGVS